MKVARWTFLSPHTRCVSRRHGVLQEADGPPHQDGLGFETSFATALTAGIAVNWLAHITHNGAKCY